MEEQTAEIERLRKEKEEMQNKMDMMVEMINSLKQKLPENRASNPVGQTSQDSPIYPPGFEPTNAPSPHVTLPINVSVTPPQPQTSTQFTFLPSSSFSTGYPSIPQQPQPTSANGGFSFTTQPNSQLFATTSSTFGNVPTNPIVITEGGNVIGTDTLTGGMGNQQVWNQIDERLRAVEGTNAYGTIDATELSLVEGLVIPPKFKIPEFEKYNRTTCPHDHITMYCRKMEAYSRDDKMLIHFF